jgi:hypothetical protein
VRKKIKKNVLGRVPVAPSSQEPSRLLRHSVTSFLPERVSLFSGLLVVLPLPHVEQTDVGFAHGVI